MRIAVKKGTVEWRQWEGSPTDDEVIFEGDIQEIMVWDEAQQNIRAPNEAEIAAAARAAMPSLTPAQLDLALLQFGLLDAVEAYVAAADRPTQIAYKKVKTFKRSNLLLNTAAGLLGMTDKQVDAVWMYGAALEPGE